MFYRNVEGLGLDLFFEPGFGMDAFTPEDIVAAQTDPAVFGLKLRREPGRHRLYGRAHAHLRQSYFNSLPKDDRTVTLV
ncbi:MAG: hypothetical protein AAB066_02230, partial [Candidatus Margulisiibacteriota bacterium]